MTAYRFFSTENVQAQNVI